MSIISSYSPMENQWHRKWPENISRHDIVYLSPLEDPIQGIPIGNGDLGALLWTEGDKLVMTINKCDTWDDNNSEEYCNRRQELTPSLSQCGKVMVDFNVPAFDLLYQKSFEARLDLAGATAKINALTPFSSINIVLYASSKYKVLVVECEVAYNEEIPVRVMLEKWGSRTFSFWYSNIKRDPSIGLDGTSMDIENNSLKIYQKLGTLDFVLGARVTGNEFEAKKTHNRAGIFECNPAIGNKFSIYLTVVTSEENSNPAAEVDRILDEAINADANVKSEHEGEWKDFWDKSFISIPEDYIENIWYLELYYSNSSSRGKYPPYFCNGLWGFNRDFMPWSFYLQWNMQYYIMPLYAANHVDNAMSYLEYRRKQLPYSMKAAREWKNKKGAFYTDVSDKNGLNDIDTSNNTSCGAMIAMEFWRHYQYTGDENFLKEMAWPVMLEVARFYADMVSKGPDGMYHIHGTQTYEASPLFDDSITDIAMMKALFPAAVKAAELIRHDRDEIKRWNDIVRDLSDFCLVPLDEDEYYPENGKRYLDGGFGKGQELMSGKVFSVGKYYPVEDILKENPDYLNCAELRLSMEDSVKKEIPFRNRYATDGKHGYYGVPDAELAAVYPSGAIGLSDRASEYFKSAVDQVRLHPPTIPRKSAIGEIDGCNGHAPDATYFAGICMGWCPYPIVLSRLGLADDLHNALKEYISTWQTYCQGFGQYGPYKAFYEDANLRWKTYMVRDADTGEKFLFPAWPFRHFDNEAMPIVCTAVNEMLLQSYDEVIRLCAAVPECWHVKFKLAATKGFMVNAEYDNACVKWVCIESLMGNVCHVVNPWGDEDTFYVVEINSSGVIEYVSGLILKQIKCDKVLEFSTIRGNRYLLVPDKADFENWRVSGESFEKNNNYKKLGDARLGLPKMY